MSRNGEKEMKMPNAFSDLAPLLSPKAVIPRRLRAPSGSRGTARTLSSDL